MTKEKEDLIVPLILEIAKANYSSKGLYGSNEVLGPGHSSWITGVIPYAKFEIKDNKYGIKIIETAGISNLNLEEGDIIKAYIKKYNEEDGKPTGLILGGEEVYQKLYIERDFQKKENISKIEKLAKNGRVLASFESDL